MIRPEPRLTVAQASQWRSWLKRNHATGTHVWLVFLKKKTGKPSLAYEDAIREALCYGWIDGMIRSLDDERYALRFSPRRPGSIWSELNRKRVELLKREGRMTPAGLASLDYTEATPTRASPRHIELTHDIESQIKKNSRAWQNLTSMAPSCRRNYIQWLMDAKRPETRARRIKEAITLLERNEKLGMK